MKVIDCILMIAVAVGGGGALDGAVTFGPAEEHPFLENHLKLGGTNPDGVRIDVNSLYFTRGGRPWIPIVYDGRPWRIPTKLFKGRKAHLAVASFKDNVYREW